MNPPSHTYQTRWMPAAARCRTMVVTWAAVVVLAVLGIATDAHAEAGTIHCTFLEITASNGPGGIDPGLDANLTKKLRRPPFSSWTSFTLEAKHQTDLALRKAQDVALKIGGNFGVLYEQHSKPTGKRDRFGLSVALDDKSGKRTLNTKIVVDTGDYFVIALSGGQEKATLLALTCRVP